MSINEKTQLRQFCVKPPTWRRVPTKPSHAVYSVHSFLVYIRLGRDVSCKIRFPKMFSAFSRKLVSKRYEWFLPLNSQSVCSLTKLTLHCFALSSPVRLDAVPCISLALSFTGLNHFWLPLGSIPTLIFMNNWTISLGKIPGKIQICLLNPLQVSDLRLGQFSPLMVISSSDS